MRLYFDTSALLKKYISENGSDTVDKLFNSATQIHVSILSHTESISAFKRLLIEKEITEKEYDLLRNEVKTDFLYFNVIDIYSEIIQFSIELIDKHQLKSLDSIQLGTAVYLKNEIDYVVACDSKLIKSAKKEGFKIINPFE
jgi:uncharacterized protein